MDKNDDTIIDEQQVISDKKQEEELLTDEDKIEGDTSKEWEDKYKRALADYQNLEKRVTEQRREWMISASREVLRQLLPVLDTLLLAQKHINDKGLEASIQQFLGVLSQEGVVRIETEGKKFDPIHMEAVGTGKGDDGKVIEEVRSGYLLHDKLLRPAQVIVGSGKEK